MIKPAATSCIDGSTDLDQEEYQYYKNRRLHRSQDEYDQDLCITRMRSSSIQASMGDGNKLEEVFLLSNKSLSCGFFEERK